MKMKAKQTMHIDAYPSNKGLERHATHIAKYSSVVKRTIQINCDIKTPVIPYSITKPCELNQSGMSIF